MAYDLIVRNGKSSMVPGCRGFTATSPLAAGGSLRSEKWERRVGAECGWLGGRSRHHRQPHALRCPGNLGPALHLLLLSRYHHCRHRQLFSGDGASASGRSRESGRSIVPCGSDPVGSDSSRRQMVMGNHSRISRRAGSTAWNECRFPNRSFRRAPLRHGRSVPGAACD